MKNTFKYIIVAIIMVLSCFMVSFSVYAKDVSVDATITLQKSSAEVANVCSQANRSVDMKGSKAILSYSTSSGQNVLKFSNKNYSTLKAEDKRTFMETALSATTKTGLTPKVKNKVYNFIASQDEPVTNAMKYLQTDSNADFVEAKKWFSPFSGVIGTILGVLCVAIFMFAGFSVIFDIVYLVLPGVQAVLERGEENKRPFGVSREAYTALKDSEKDNEYRNVIAIYMKRRLGLILLMSICLTYLISGKIYDVVMFFVDAFSSI